MPDYIQAANNLLAGKYLTFHLAEEEYGLEILKVKEIIGLMKITGLPQTPPFVKGVINLRGKVIPVIDLRIKFDMQEIEPAEKTCIIVVENSKGGAEFQTGIIVDSVSEVLNVAVDDIQETPEFGVTLDTDYILGMAKSNGNVKSLLNISNVLNSIELDEISEAV